MAEWIIVVLLVLVIFNNPYRGRLDNIISQLGRIEGHLAEILRVTSGIGMGRAEANALYDIRDRLSEHFPTEEER